MDSMEIATWLDTNWFAFCVLILMAMIVILLRGPLGNAGTRLDISVLQRTVDEVLRRLEAIEKRLPDREEKKDE